MATKMQIERIMQKIDDMYEAKQNEMAKGLKRADCPFTWETHPKVVYDAIVNGEVILSKRNKGRYLHDCVVRVEDERADSWLAEYDRSVKAMDKKIAKLKEEIKDQLIFEKVDVKDIMQKVEDVLKSGY